MQPIGIPMSAHAELSPAETALSLLFRKLHPLLEDAAHLQARGATKTEFEKLHVRLNTARNKVVDILEDLSEVGGDPELEEILETLAANLTPVGESFQQGLIMTQICLEEAPKDLLKFAPHGSTASPWGKRMIGFLQRLEDPAFQANQRWKEVDPDLGEETLE
jgi:hypothetical protein